MKWLPSGRIAALRAVLATADLPQPVYRWRVPDGRQRLPGRRPVSRWEAYQGRVRAALARR